MAIGSVGPSVSGLALQQARVRESSNNVANVLTEEFRPREVVARAEASGGVRAETVEIEGPPSLIREVVNQRAAVAAYQANISVLRTSDEMTQSLLDKLR